VDIAIIYAKDSTHLAGTFCSIVDQHYPGLNIDVHTWAEQSRFVALESAHRIVIFVSEEFLTSEQHMQELHLSLNRQRSSSRNVLYLIQTTELTSRPFFPRLLPYDVVCSDPVWTELQTKHMGGLKIERRVFHCKGGNRLGHANTFFCFPRVQFAIEKCTDDILESLIYNR